MRDAFSIPWGIVTARVGNCVTLIMQIVGKNVTAHTRGQDGRRRRPLPSWSMSWKRPCHGAGCSYAGATARSNAFRAGTGPDCSAVRQKRQQQGKACRACSRNPHPKTRHFSGSDDSGITSGSLQLPDEYGVASAQSEADQMPEPEYGITCSLRNAVDVFAEYTEATPPASSATSPTPGHATR